MKTMVAIFIPIIMISTFIISCDNGNNSEKQLSPQDRLNGSWKVISATGEFASINEGTIYTFEGKEKLSTKLGIFTSNGNIKSITDSTFAVRFAGMENDSEYKFRFENENLIIEPRNSGQLLTLKKQ